VTNRADPRATLALRDARVDLGRGAIMALMALDHTRTFLTEVPFSPTDLARTYPALFFTRWTSQYCTPLFLFLAGVGAFLMTRRRTAAEAAWLLLSRGVVLVALEMTVVRWGWYFNFDYRHTSPQILWAIGVSMIGLAPLVWLPARVVGGIGIGVVALHNLFGPMLSAASGGHWVWALLYERGRAITLAPDVVFAVNFPPLPLFGLMAAGYGFGEILGWSAVERRRGMVGLGAMLTGAFVVLRTFNLYGDPAPWAPQQDTAHSVMSFFLLTKHPLSLLMTLATVGPALIWLAVVRPDRPLWRALVTIGRVPMFFYLVHVPVIHAIALGLSLAWYGDAAWLLTSPFDRPPAAALPAGWGVGLPGVYVWTLVVLALLYPACRWYGDLKARTHSRALRYI
jgi:uncharacterized membrane protein